MSYNATLSFSAPPGSIGLERFNLYVSKDNVNWEETLPNIGKSPFTITPDFNGKYYTYILSNLENYVKYYFKISLLGQYSDQSSYSNSLNCTIYTIDYTIQNFYRTAGGLLTGIYPISSNTGSGTILAGTVTYDDLNYGAGLYEISAVYDSYILYAANGISSIVFTGIGNAGDITIYYREYILGVPGAWSAGQNGIGVGVTLTLAGQQFIQLRYIFKNTSWVTSDNITVTQVNEL
jgi:hypothetical protein